MRSTFFRRLAVSGVALLAAAPAYSQTPFQSAPAPGPVPSPFQAAPGPPPLPPPVSRPRAAPTPQADPTPAVDAESLFWQAISSSNNSADFETYLRRFPQGRFAAQAQARIAALIPPLTGHWRGTVSCSYGSGGMDIDVAQTGPDQYAVTGDVTGTISGKQAHFEESKLINHIVYQGTVNSATTMGGTYRQSMTGETCNWSLNKN